jgi:6-pyruvoyltetrahydropterin/6-carboxytetrahydropterin synthase
MKYTSTKEYINLGPVNYRQWRADSHCKYWHGYALSFKFYFKAATLDARNWVMDYGGLRPLKGLLEDWFDHKTLVAEDDPELEFHKEAEARGLCRLTIVERTGCEGLADFLIRYVNEQFLPLYGERDRVVCCRVEVRESASNMAYAEWEECDDEAN